MVGIVISDRSHDVFYYIAPNMNGGFFMKPFVGRKKPSRKAIYKGNE